MQVPARVGNRTPKQPRRSTTYGKGNAVRNQQAQAMAPKRYLETQAQGKLSSVALETLSQNGYGSHARSPWRCENTPSISWHLSNFHPVPLKVLLENGSAKASNCKNCGNTFASDSNLACISTSSLCAGVIAVYSCSCDSHEECQ